MRGCIGAGGGRGGSGVDLGVGGAGGRGGVAAGSGGCCFAAQAEAR